MNMLNNIKITMMHRGSTAAASADIDSTVHLDMKGYEGCLFITGIEETTAGGTTGSASLKPRYASSSTGSLTDYSTASYAASAVGSLTTSDWGKALIVDVYKPTDRYLSVSLDKAGAASWDHGPIYGIQYGGRKGPITQSSSHVKASKLAVSPST